MKNIITPLEKAQIECDHFFEFKGNSAAFLRGCIKCGKAWISWSGTWQWVRIQEEK